MAFSGPPIGGLPENQNRGAQRVRDRARERARNESSTTKTIGGILKFRKHAAITSTTPPASLGYIFAGPPGPLPSVYGTILSGRY